MDLVPELLREKPFFPPELQQIAKGKFIDYENAPEYIETAGTKILDVLEKFRSRTEIEAIKRIKQGRSKMAKHDELYREYAISVEDTFSVSTPDDFFPSSLIVGEKYGVTIEQRSSPLHIHLHPGPDSFSNIDYGRMLYNLGAIDIQLQNQKKPVMEVISTDDGYFLTFSTENSFSAVEPYIPNQKKSTLFDVMNGDSDDSQEYIDLENSYWRKLRSLYTMESFMDPSSWIGSTPNVYGHALVHLYRNLQIDKEFKMPLYYMSRTGTKFNRVHTVEELFPQLIRR